jgi:hypothetical protein
VSGRGGAFAAKADDLSAVAVNPAGLGRLQGTRVQVGNRFSYNALQFERAPTLDWGDPEDGEAPLVRFSPVDNETPWQLLDPFVGVASDLGLRSWVFALAAYTPAGVSRLTFPVDGGQRYLMVKREAIILNYTASAAWRPQDDVAVGASLQWVHVPRLTYELVIDGTQFPGDANPVWSELDMVARVAGSDPFVPNAVVGVWYRPAPYLELGLSGQAIPTEIRTTSQLSIEPASPEIDEDVELRRDGELADDVSLRLPLALTARAGVRYVLRSRDTEVFDVELDGIYESWSRVDRFTVETNGLVASLLGQRLDVGDIDIDKHWQDTISVHLGSDYALVPRALAVRSGLFYESAVADGSYANVDFASGRQVGAAVGASLFVQGAELALAYEYRHQLKADVAKREARVYQEVPGSGCEPPYTAPDTCHPEYLGQPAPTVNGGIYRARHHVVSIDGIYRF